MKVVVDGDSVAYKAAFSTQYQTYHIEEEEIAFRYQKDCISWLSLNFDADERPDPVKIQVLEPLNHSFHIVNKIIEGIATDTKASELVIYISGENNFRKNIPYPVVYKGGRPDKPIHLPEIREFLIRKHGAIVCDNHEADDAIGIYAYANVGCTIASVDKDLRMLAGKHYHLDKKDFTEVTELDGIRSFYKQMLVGDRVDNIIGVDKIGTKTAEKLIDKLYGEAEMDRVVKEKYKEFFKDNWHQMYRANKDLLWILRSTEELEGVQKEYANKLSEGQGPQVTAVDSGSDQISVQSA
jgi:hypothetical protein